MACLPGEAINTPRQGRLYVPHQHSAGRKTVNAGCRPRQAERWRALRLTAKCMLHTESLVDTWQRQRLKKLQGKRKKNFYNNRLTGDNGNFISGGQFCSWELYPELLRAQFSSSSSLFPTIWGPGCADEQLCGE